MASMHRSLTKSASSGVRTASRLSVRVAAPKRAIAVIGAKLGGCGIRRVTAASSTADTRIAVRVFMAVSLLVDGVILIGCRRAKVRNTGFGFEVDSVQRPT